MTKKQFRSDTKKVAQWAKILAMPITQEVLQVLRDDGPEFEGRVIGASEADVRILFGHRAGFADHHRQLEQMAEKIPLRQAKPDATYEPDGRE